MTIDDLKRALVEVRDICMNACCSKCPIAKMNENTGIPFCPLNETEDGFDIRSPMDWDIDEWMEDTNEAD